MIYKNRKDLLMFLCSIFIMFTFSLNFFIPGTMVSAGNYSEVTFEMLSETNIVLITENNQTGIDAVSTRLKIDADHGNSNGIVEESEIEGYKNSINDQASDLTITQNTFYDGIALDIKSTVVEVTNADGPTNSTTPLQVIYTTELNPLKDPGKPKWHSIAFKGEYYSNNTLKIIAPKGWKISQNPKNFQVSNRSDDSREVSGIAIGTFNIEIKMYKPSRFDDEANDSVVGDLFATGNILYLLLPLILVVVIIIILLTRRKNPEKGSNVENEIKDEPDEPNGSGDTKGGGEKVAAVDKKSG